MFRMIEILENHLILIFAVREKIIFHPKIIQTQTHKIILKPSSSGSNKNHKIIQNHLKIIQAQSHKIILKSSSSGSNKNHFSSKIIQAQSHKIILKSSSSSSNKNHKIIQNHLIRKSSETLIQRMGFHGFLDSMRNSTETVQSDDHCA